LAAQLGPALAAPAAAAQGSLAQLLNVTAVSFVKDATGAITGLQATIKSALGTQKVALDLTASPGADPSTPILHLHLNPIELDLLGLDVATSAICLDITANPNGGLLGSLLSKIGNLLNGGASLGSALSSLGPLQKIGLTTGLTSLLNGAVQDVLTQGTVTLMPAADTEPEPPGHHDTAHTCEVLNLSLGPVTLDLLGLNVSLDDCNGGPIIVDVDAIPHQDPGGGILGDLLCALV